MDVIWRHAQLEDLKGCFAFMDERSVYHPAEKKELFHFWECLIENKACIPTVYEDPSRPKDERAVGIALTLFVNDTFAQEVITTAPPYLSLNLIRETKEGRRPFLQGDEIHEANIAEGLNLVALHRGLRSPKRSSEHDRSSLKTAYYQSFFPIHDGYRIKQVIAEFIGAENLKETEHSGGVVYRDYAEFKNRRAYSERMRANPPFLSGLDIETSRKRGGFYYLDGIFRHFGPRFRFGRCGQQTLQRALRSETDSEIAVSLGLSVWTIKKRWQDIYARVNEVDPGFFTENRTGKPELNLQRRRLLLDYLRRHPEEFQGS